MNSNQDVKDRIRVRMAEKNLKQTNVADAIGASKGTISKWLAGKNVPKNDYLIRLARLLHTTPEWIISGTGPIDVDDVSSDSISTGDKDYLVSKLGLQHDIDYDDDLLIEMNGGDIDYEAKAFNEEIDSQVEGLMLAGMTGIINYTNNSDAMMPVLYSDAECSVNTDVKEVRDGKIYLYRHGLTVNARYLHKRHDGGYLVRCANKSYSDEIISADQLHDFEVIGWLYKWTNEEKW